MHIVMFGAGGVGGYFGGRLARGGERVTFIARGEHLQAMQTTGLVVDSIKGNFSVQPVVATDDPTTVKDVDVIFLAVKAWQIPEAAKAIQPMLGPDTFVVPLENGVEAAAQVAEIIGSERIVGGLCGIFSHIVSPGHIQHTGSEPFIDFGELDNCPTERVHNLLAVLENAGIQSEIPTDINLAIWQKFLFVSAFMGVGSLTRVPIEVYRTHKEALQLFESAVIETYKIGIARDINLPSDSVAKVMVTLNSIPPNTLSSMQRDIMSGRPSELETMIGVVVRMGQSLDLPTPVNSFIYNSLLPQEILARARLNEPEVSKVAE